MANLKSSLFEDGTGSNDPEGKDERVLLYPDNPDAVWLFTDDHGKPLFGVKRGEGVDTDKAYQTFTLAQPDSQEDIQFAIQNHQPYRGSVVGLGHLSNELRGMRGVPEGKHTLYRHRELAELPDGSKVLGTEGERDAENAWRVGVPATAVFGTATKAYKQHWGGVLGRKELVLTYDLDNGGLRRCQEMIKKHDEFSDTDPGKPDSISVMRLDWIVSDADRGFDVTDFLGRKAVELDKAEGSHVEDEDGRPAGTHFLRWLALSTPPDMGQCAMETECLVRTSASSTT